MWTEFNWLKIEHGDGRVQCTAGFHKGWELLDQMSNYKLCAMETDHVASDGRRFWC
jgi:hypothetical protein